MKFSRPPQSAYSDTLTSITPAKAGVQYGGRLVSGLRRNDELNVVANQKVLFSTKSKTHIAPEVVDLARPGVMDKIVSREVVANWGLKDIEQLWAT